jgi:CBS domain-containing protein
MKETRRERAMNVSDVMHHSVRTCSVRDTLDRVARVMWELDCGCVPLVDDDGKVVAMITDRDISMAAYLQGQPLSKIVARSAASRSVTTVHENATVETVEALMRDRQVRRIPVVDDDLRPVGIVSLNDLVSHSHPGGRRREGLSAESIARTLAAICEHPQASLS